MAYNSFFPQTYQPNYYNGYYQQPVQPVPQMTQPTQQQPQQQVAIRQGGFIRVQSEEEAFAYPVAPGNSVTFINETAPYCYVKTMGFSQLDRPTFERYRLVKEETPQNAQETAEQPDKENRPMDEYALKSDLAKAQRDIAAIQVSLNALNERKPKKRVVVEEEDDDE